MTDAIVAGKPEPKYLRLFRKALSSGYRIDAVAGKAYRPDGSEWLTSTNGAGYLRLQAKIDGEHLHITLHKAIAYSLWGDAAVGGTAVHVRHLNSDKLNCLEGNLALGTAQDNALDKPASQRSRAVHKRAATLGKQKLSDIASKSNATRGHEASVAYGRMGGEAKKKLTPDQVVMVRENASKPTGDRIPQRKLAAMLGVKQGTICDILAGRCYGDVEISSSRLGEY